MKRKGAGNRLRLSHFLTALLSAVPLLPAHLLASEIQGIVSATEFESQPQAQPVGTFFGIFGNEEQFLGYARSLSETRYRLVTLVNTQELVRTGDRLKPLDFSHGDSRPPPHAALLQYGDRRVHSRFKRLAYLGVFLGEGQALDEGEWLIDPLVQVQYGLAERLTLGTSHLTASFGAPNFLAKLQVFEGESANFAQAVNVAYRLSERQTLTQLTSVLALPSSGRMLTHMSLIVTIDSADLEEKVQTAGSLLQTRLQSATQIILNDWSRLLVGPIYNFDVKAIGGFAQWLWIFRYTHVGLGLQTQNLGELRLNARDGYSPILTVFWRI